MKLDELKPGRELDALIAEKVMGWEEQPVRWLVLDGGYEEHYAKNYSTSISAAWEVLVKLDTWVQVIRSHKEAFMCEVSVDRKPGYVYATGDSAPHAICLAALKAIEGTKDAA